MAGVEKEFRGETILAPGYTIGYLEQEPQLPAERTVREVVEEGVQEVVALLKEFEEINAKLAEPMDDDAMSAILERQGAVQEKLDALGGWDLDSRLEMAMDALRCPPAELKRRRPLGRRDDGAWRCAGSCCRSRTSCCWTSPRTTWTRKPWPGWSTTWCNTRARSSR